MVMIGLFFYYIKTNIYETGGKNTKLFSDHYTANRAGRRKKKSGSVTFSCYTIGLSTTYVGLISCMFKRYICRKANDFCLFLLSSRLDIGLEVSRGTGKILDIMLSSLSSLSVR